MFIILTKKNEGTPVIVNTDYIYRIEKDIEGGSSIYFISVTAHVRESPTEILKTINFYDRGGSHAG